METTNGSSGGVSTAGVGVKTRVVEEGERWRCLRCGICCRNDFELGWISSFIPEYMEERCHGFCPHFVGYQKVSICVNYHNRPYACRIFPFTLQKKPDGGYNLVVHMKCQGIGRGRKINIRRRIAEIARYSNKAYNLKNRLVYSENPHSYILTLKTRKTQQT